MKLRRPECDEQPSSSSSANMVTRPVDDAVRGHLATALGADDRPKPTSLLAELDQRPPELRVYGDPAPRALLGNRVIDTQRPSDAALTVEHHRPFEAGDLRGA